MSKPRAHTYLALLLANVRYWTTVAPLVHIQIARWERQAEEIPDAALRELALSKLREERFNVELAATMATLANRRYRRTVVEATVALQITYDYLDSLIEQTPDDRAFDSGCLFDALSDAFTPLGTAGDSYYRDHPYSEDGYLEGLVLTVAHGIAELPKGEVVGVVASRGAKRCAQAQILSHSKSPVAAVQLERWAQSESARTDLQWREYLAGAAASVLALHALIAAAANRRTTTCDAEKIDAAYLSIAALSMLDSLVDWEHDRATGQLNYVALYDEPELMATRLAGLARDALDKAARLPNAAHHTVTLVGIVAYYLSAPDMSDAPARTITKPIRRELGVLMVTILGVMRIWRVAKWMRGWGAHPRLSGWTGTAKRAKASQA